MNCGVRYYPQWSSRGIRSVQCDRPAKYTVVAPPSWSAEHVCGIHRRAALNFGLEVLDGIYIRSAS